MADFTIKCPPSNNDKKNLFFYILSLIGHCQTKVLNKICSFYPQNFYSLPIGKVEKIIKIFLNKNGNITIDASGRVAQKKGEEKLYVK